MSRKDYIDLLNRRNRMDDTERRQDIINETFASVFSAFMPLSDCDGCKETLEGQSICCMETVK